MALRSWKIGVDWFAALRPHSRANWAEAVRHVIQSLGQVNRSTEEDFLRVGAKLIDFRSASRNITSGLSTLTELISGEQAVDASQSLRHILEYSQSLDRSVEESGVCLKALSELAGTLRRAFAGISPMVCVLRNLCTLTRVETARLGDSNAVFGDLAADVIPLSESIQSSGTEVLNAAAQLDNGVQTALRTVAALRLRQQQEVSPLMDAATEGIHAFAERQQTVRDASSRQAEQYQAVSDAIDGLVGNIQFHDITRQQVEHVIEGLGRACMVNAAQAGPVLRLQSSQLRNSAKMFTTAVAGIEINLKNVAARMAVMAENSAGLLGGPEGDHHSFFVRIEENFSRIVDSMSACGAAQAEIQAVPTQIAALVTQLKSAIDQIRVLEIRIQRTAMNASIRAVHIGDAGASLAVIAEEMGRLVAASSANTEEAAGAVESISAIAARLAGDGNLARSSQEACTRVTVAIGDMQSAAEISYSRVSEIASLHDQLAEDIQKLRDSLAGTVVYGTTMENDCVELERIADELPAGESSEAPGLEDLTTRYTMQIERDIHDQVTQGAAGSVDPLGDNVEMF